MTTAEKISYLKIEKFAISPRPEWEVCLRNSSSSAICQKNNTKQEEGNTKSRTRKRIDGGNFVVDFLLCRMTMTVKKPTQTSAWESKLSFSFIMKLSPHSSSSNSSSARADDEKQKICNLTRIFTRSIIQITMANKLISLKSGATFESIWRR